ncbi:hypothetical protein E0Y77_21890 [Salmonella enterica subsp. enterica serovar Miami]|uniref:Uncharacterized protein n=1 Tax=Salmonella enterica TaxID=28901 RepID=A0A639X812_SALER|nr:hypothetical protein [Salmonella enterica]EBR8828739.1 hypothetical protein [Salmonella enterica subsp. enterica serovar Thompson]EBV0974511.1 hypothetical protein [Salmonella enterica subsp. enterica serovar Miami]ECS9257857.1 hypothetical protein [Salmonella enterica subsp. enterica serovar Typhimurium]ECT4851974.1 hypothetical protein [Salmonella enterica subsp. enterica serovar Saintpaul]ECY3828986.1 hypothetical protein [Salmonella enterica subsp. enterica serovar Senftenberg]EDS63738
MDNVLKTIHTGFSCGSATLIQSLEDFGIKRGDDGELIFPRHSDKRFPIGRIRKRLASYGWRGDRLNQEVARIVAGPDIFPERSDYSIIFPYGWERNQLTPEMRRMFPRKTGRRVLLMLDEFHYIHDARERQTFAPESDEAPEVS